ncbi:MAG: ATP-binding protein [Ruminococcaceae bacterium]|nr:ATP-binding protein [Oscillospiraceae bacterium]
MTYNKEIYESAKDKLEKRRTNAERKAREVKNTFLSQNKRAEQLIYLMGQTSSRIAREVLSGGNVREKLTVLKNENLKCQAEFDEILKKNGLTKKDITPDYFCKECSDTGFKDGVMCNCFRQLIKNEAYEKLNEISPLKVSRFEDFDLGYYDLLPEKQRSAMYKTFEYCKSYAENFSLHSDSLLFMGSTGLGKTHLSLAIAGVVISKGFGVVYGSAQSFASMIERERFKEIENEDVATTLISADLLILDDLGVEFQSPYVTSVLYNIIDSRIMKNAPTIISTNLSIEDIKKKYSERLVSRILGGFSRINFYGKDIRLLKRGII